MTAHANISIDQLAVRPIKSLREDDGFVMIVTRTGYTHAPYGTHIARLVDDGYEDCRGDGIRRVYGETLMGWMPIPFEQDDVEQAFRMNADFELNAAAQMPLLEGDLSDHLHKVRNTVLGAEPGTKSRRIMADLFRQLGCNVNGPQLPAGAPLALAYVRTEITHWVQGNATDDGALLAVTECLTKYHPAFPHGENLEAMMS